MQPSDASDARSALRTCLAQALTRTRHFSTPHFAPSCASREHLDDAQHLHARRRGIAS